MDEVVKSAIAKVVERLRIGDLLSNAIERPLTAAETALFASLGLVIASAYCQIYCLIAFPAMHGAVMPVVNSVQRVAIDVLPAIAAFELSKRALHRLKGPEAFAMVLLIFAAALVAATAARSSSTIMTNPDYTLRRMAADRLPVLFGAALALLWAQFYRKRRGESAQSMSSEPELVQLPPASVIEMIRAAGNYVEIQYAGRSTLLRMSLRQAANQLPSSQFVQVHRSVIVNRNYVAENKGRRRLRMADGTEVRVGDVYRSNVSTI